jgi:allophanate hydrolase
MMSSVRVTDLKGLWRRSLIVSPDGRRDTTTDVRWLQGADAYYVDLRRPASLPDFTHVAVLADLSMDDCRCLALQEGFAGQLSFDGRHFEWVRHIDFQPKSPNADAGSLTWDDEVLIERGRDAAYVEHWHRDAAAATVPHCAVALREAGTGTGAILLRLGDTFMFARDRAMPLPPQSTLHECVAAAATLQTAQRLVDCEISAGIVGAAGFRITASTLPFRCGHPLEPRVLRNGLTTCDHGAGGITLSRTWNVIDSEGDLDALIDHNPQ